VLNEDFEFVLREEVIDYIIQLPPPMAVYSKTGRWNPSPMPKVMPEVGMLSIERGVKAQRFL